MLSFRWCRFSQMLGIIYWNSLSRRILNVCSTPYIDFECMAVVVLLTILIAHLHLLHAQDTNCSLTEPNLFIAPESKVPKIKHRPSFTSPCSSYKNTASVTFCNGREVQRCMAGSLTTGVAPGGTLANISIRSLRKRNGWIYNCYRQSSVSSRLCSLSFLPPAVAPQPVTDTVIATNPRGEEGKLVPQATPSPVGQAKCRPSIRSSPLRLSLLKPDRTHFFLDARGERDSTARDSPSTSDTGASFPSSSEIGCGDVEGGMTSTFTWLESVNSTMDEAKTLAVEQKGNRTSGVFAVAAREQLRGRGTKGRAWLGLPGNVFLTVAIPLERVPVPLSLIPLRVGTLIAPEIERRLRHRSTSVSAGTEDRTLAQPDEVPHQPRVSLKWPNDVLLEGKKVAGVLIEAQLPFLLVGIGVNVRNKPDVPQQGPDRGRPAVCLEEYGGDSSDQAVRALSASLTEALCSWVSGEDSAELALAEWSRWVDWTLPLEIRDERRVVTPVGVASDGRLRVVDPDTGEEKLLATEYLF